MGDAKPDVFEDYLTVTQAAKRLRLSRQRVYVFIRSGRLPARALGGAYLLARADVEAFRKVERFPGRPEQLKLL